jgi:glycosyltransferase involved in cell wall biosynthesis
MILGIDAANIRSGGGVTHLVELLRAADPISHGFSKVIVWSGQSTLDRIKDQPWLLKSHQPLLDKALPWRAFWQQFQLSGLARSSGCNILFVPGGSYTGNFRPFVTMSQNLLPFEWKELRRYGWSLMTLKNLMLRRLQSRCFHQADGMIFLSEFAKKSVLKVTGRIKGQTKVIPHGLNERFVITPKEQHPIEKYNMKNVYRLLYVSKIDQYKHQWQVAEAVAYLRREGLPLVLDLVGSAYPPSFKRLKNTLARLDPDGNIVFYHGLINYEELHKQYAQADLGIFASSCETFGQILVETMAAGLPIACSNQSTMPEILGDAGVYFDPEKPEDIARALKELINSPELRTRLAWAFYDRAKLFTWQCCARETFGFLANIANNN